MRSDFIIVGGGPAGSMVARILASKGYNTIILEEHPEIGKPVSCAGLVTERVIKIAGVSNDTIMNDVKGASIHFPNGKEIEIGGDKKHAVVIDREKFDKEMMEIALAEGVECIRKWRVKNAYLKNNSIVVEGKENITCRYLIGADGARSIIAKNFSFPPVKEYVLGVQTSTSFKGEGENVEIFIGEKIAPGFFAWVIPEGKRARIGLGVKKGYSPKRYFMQFLKMVGAEKGEINAGFIPIHVRKKFVRRKVALVGDAAGHVKATSGGGLYPGLMASKILGGVAIKSIEDGEGLIHYEKKYMNGFGMELERCILMRKIFLRMDDKKMSKIFSFFDEKDIKIINRYGDIDYPSIVAKKLITNNLCLFRLTKKILNFRFL